ncbi:DnaJ domain-containing protein [Crocosphaera chwakensis]|uniref:Serine/Threonine protein kinase with WD40 repeats n=1 Tax=Crocosphaera chwakensis CCY0110 TaxID=391612 RepID=A3IWX4_9CHRO|nr:DnaJ domain-containing protein [Crocosphaera chwakensis]EAZ89025.1 Serine/Threonine protein kinase with WD40 repeats [Crocosphaera chwakensis CCY0110]
MTNDIRQYYQVLGVSADADLREVKQVYRQLAKLWHPDNFHDNPQQQQQAEIKFKVIVEAYEVIKDYLKNDKSLSKASNIHVKKTNPEFHYQQGTIYAETEQYQDAIAEFSKAIYLDKNYIKAYQYRGFIFSKLGYENRANADFKKVDEIKLKEIYQESSSKVDCENNKPDSKQESNSGSRNQSHKANVDYSPRKWKLSQEIKGHSQPVNLVAISSNSQILASVAQSKTIKLWNLSKGYQITLLSQHKSLVRCLKFTPNNQYLISGSEDKTIIIWDLKSYQGTILGREKNGHNKAVLSLDISSDSKHLISGSADKTTKIWSLISKEDPYTLTGYGNEILTISMSPNGDFFVSGGLEKFVRIRCIDTGKIIRSIKINSGITSLAFSPDNQLLVIGGLDRVIRLWNWQTGEEIGQLTGHLETISQLLFRDNGKELISISYHEPVKIWNIETLEQIDSVNNHSKGILCGDISSNGKTLVIGSDDNTIRVFYLK